MHALVLISAEHQDPLEGLLPPLGPIATGTSTVGFIAWHGENLGSTDQERSIPKHHPCVIGSVLTGHSTFLTMMRRGLWTSASSS